MANNDSNNQGTQDTTLSILLSTRQLYSKNNVKLDSVHPIGSLIFVPHRGAVADNLVPADGRLLLKSDYPDLFNALQVAIGNYWDLVAPVAPNASQFAVPDLRGRVLMHEVNGGTNGHTASRILGGINGVGGTDAHTLSATEMPVHDHGISAVAIGSNGHISSTTSLNNLLKGGATFPSFTRVENAGSGGAHNNMQPYTAGIYYIRAY